MMSSSTGVRSLSRWLIVITILVLFLLVPILATNMAGRLGFLEAGRLQAQTPVVVATDADQRIADDDVGLPPSNSPPSDLQLTLSAAVINEGGSLSFTASFTDPGVIEPHVAYIDWGDSFTEPLPILGGVYAFSGSHQYVENGAGAEPGEPPNNYFISVLVADSAGQSTSAGAYVTVNNVSPSILAFDAPTAPTALNTPIQVTASFTDPGALDTHFFTLAWGDGSSFTEPLPSGQYDVLAFHVYDQPGVYEVALAVTDDDAGTDTVLFQYVVVYDTDGGFVTGGGWIDSPAGAYVPDPDLTGKAAFGFVSRYKKGASTPAGNTEFQFRAADLNFRSTSYDWLVVNQGGTNAQYKGTGTINGAPSPTGTDFAFMVWARDDEADTFRIRIWYEDVGVEVVVYDNGFDQSIGGGSIVIHGAQK